MLAKKCDRCGKLYEFYESHSKENCNGFEFVIMSMYESRGISSGFKDLCQECLDSLVRWYEMKEIPKEENKSVNPTSEDIIDTCNKIERKFNYEFKYK